MLSFPSPRPYGERVRVRGSRLFRVFCCPSRCPSPRPTPHSNRRGMGSGSNICHLPKAAHDRLDTPHRYPPRSHGTEASSRSQNAGLHPRRRALEKEPRCRRAHQEARAVPNPACDQGLRAARRFSDHARNARRHDGERRIRSAHGQGRFRQGSARLFARLLAGRSGAADQARASHLFQFARADRRAPAGLEKGERLDRPAHQSGLLARHGRRRLV